MWMKTDFYFGDSYAIFTVSARQLYCANEIRDTVASNQGNPEELEKMLIAIIEHYRPALKGGSLVRISHSIGGLRWEMIYTHPSLPKVAFGTEPPYLPLIPHKGEENGAIVFEDGKGGMRINNGSDEPYVPSSWERQSKEIGK